MSNDQWHTNSDGREFNFQMADRDTLIAEIGKQSRKRHYHFELFQRYRERMVGIICDTTRLIDWYEDKLRGTTAGTNETDYEMQQTINEFKQLLQNETSCSVCHRVCRGDIRNCLIPRCAHLIHTSNGRSGSAEQSCYAQLKRAAIGNSIPCPVCGMELPKHVMGRVE